MSVDVIFFQSIDKCTSNSEVAPRLRAYEVPRRVHVLRAADEFTVEGGLLTPKLSKKRGPIGEKYAAVIEALYDDG